MWALSQNPDQLDVDLRLGSIRARRPKRDVPESCDFGTEGPPSLRSMYAWCRFRLVGVDRLVTCGTAPLHRRVYPNESSSTRGVRAHRHAVPRRMSFSALAF